MTGVVWAENPNPQSAPAQPHERCRSASTIAAAKRRTAPVRRLGAELHIVGRGMVLRMTLADGRASRPRARYASAFGSAGPPPAADDARHARVSSSLFADGMTARQRRRGAKEAGVSIGVVDGLVDEGTLKSSCRRPRTSDAAAGSGFRQARSLRAQLAAADALRTTVDQGGYFVDFGRRRHRFRQNRSLFRSRGGDTFASGRQTLILMPEIALTGQSLDRFTARFGTRPAEWHSQLRATHPRPHLGGGGVGRSVGRCRRALGAVSALCRSRAYRCR